jgi:phospho-N-acetylmuramoyl-pentapeptide-transferase
MSNIGIVFDLLLLFLSFIISFVLYPFWISFVYKFQLGDISRVHEEKQGTPTMGGFVFVLTVAIVTILFNRSRNQTLLPLFVATLAGLLGIIDDLTKVFYKSGLPLVFEHWQKVTFIRNIHLPKLLLMPWNLFKELSRVVGSNSGSGIETYKKFFIQGGMAVFVSYWTYFKLGWDYFWFPLIGNVHVGFLYPLIIFFFFIIVLNCVAFTDGLDGLAGGLSVFVFLAFWVISRSLGYYMLSAFCATFVGVLLPFLYFNIYPARIFMGNVGSHVLGAVMAVLAVVLHREIPFILISLVFLVDGITSPLQQLSVKLTKKRLFRMAPFHHHFEKLGWPESKVTMRFWLFGGFFAFIGILLALL